MRQVQRIATPSGLVSSIVRGSPAVRMPRHASPVGMRLSSGNMERSAVVNSTSPITTTRTVTTPASTSAAGTASTASAHTVAAAPVRTLHLDSIHNFRDLAEACSHIQPGRVLRCAKPSEASEADVAALLQGAGIRDLIDLRSADELAEDPAGSHLFARATLQRYTRQWASGQVQAESGTSSSASVVHHNVSLLERRRYYISLMRHIPATSLAKAIALRLVNAEWSRLVLLRHVNEGGLPLLYRILVDSAAPEIGTVMRLVLSGLEAQRPVLVFCKAGKDRTGIIGMLVLSCAGATEAEIVDDYKRSDSWHAVALAGIENKPELRGLDVAVFERAPEAAVRALIEHIDTRYGGPAAYLETACGFGRAEQARLRELLTAPLK